MEGEGEHDASQESSTWTVDYCASRCNLTSEHVRYTETAWAFNHMHASEARVSMTTTSTIKLCQRQVRPPSPKFQRPPKIFTKLKDLNSRSCRSYGALFESNTYLSRK